jgi:hypothetical protein
MPSSALRERKEATERAERAMRQDDLPGTEIPATGTAVAVLCPAAEQPSAAGPRPLSGFVTQLLACHGRFPAYRSRRRAEPRALASYGSHGGGPPVARIDRIL